MKGTVIFFLAFTVVPAMVQQTNAEIPVKNRGRIEFKKQQLPLSGLLNPGLVAGLRCLYFCRRQVDLF